MTCEAPRIDIFSEREAQFRKLAIMVVDEMDRIVANRRLHPEGQPIVYEELLTVARDAVFSREVVLTDLRLTSFDYYVTNLYTYRVVLRDPQHSALRKRLLPSSILQAEEIPAAYSKIDRTTSHPRSSTK